MDTATYFSDFLTKLQLETAPQVINIVVVLAPLWLPFLLFKILWPIWITYIQALAFINEKFTLIEVRLPKETMKSPLAMELFLTSLHQTGGEGSWYDKYWLGKTRPSFSLEMVSLEGSVHFFIWMRAAWRPFLESSLYAQFPGIEIHERPEDYAKNFHIDTTTTKLWGAELVLTKPDPYPIKTYVDYGLDKDPKEEVKVDPIAPLIEYLGSIGVNQQVWIQYIVRAHKAEKRVKGHLFKFEDAWKVQAKEEVNKILKRDPKTLVSGEENDQGFLVAPTITKGEQDIVAALERSITKQAFDVSIRIAYIAKKEFFNPSNISGLTGSFKQFASEHLNGFKPNGDMWSPSFSYPWQDFKEIRQNGMRKGFVATYKRRALAGQQVVLNTEELATVFHFPGQVAQTPTLTRIGSKKMEAPANLPI